MSTGSVQVALPTLRCSAYEFGDEFWNKDSANAPLKTPSSQFAGESRESMIMMMTMMGMMCLIIYLTFQRSDFVITYFGINLFHFN